MSAKDIRVEPIASKTARALVRTLHYSHKVCANSQLHLGVFLNGRLEGAMQFGPPMDRRKLIGLVRGTQWNGFLELNRLAFSDQLPRNSESRALGVALRMIRREYPHIEWIVSFADATQCGDGTIYRAANFVLTAINKNKTILQMPGGARLADISLNTSVGKFRPPAVGGLMTRIALDTSRYVGSSSGWWKRHGAAALPGFQLRYVYFLNPAARARLTVPIIPFSEIEKSGASMYRGNSRVKQAMADDQSAQRRGSDDRPAPIP